jgi:mono/diheme cytochrome c family protein
MKRTVLHVFEMTVRDRQERICQTRHSTAVGRTVLPSALSKRASAARADGKTVRPTWLILLGSMAIAHAATVAADSTRGERLFETLFCIECHSVNGMGGHIAPDLGRRIDRHFTSASLASTMWNHAPAMWAAMRDREIRVGDLDEQAAADLFAYFYSARFFEKPGDAGRGKRLFTERACALCHGLTEEVKPGIKPVRQWNSLADPIALTEAMWNHGPNMFAEFKLNQIPWPVLSGQDLSDLLVYLRNLPSTREKPGVFETASGSNGEVIFQVKGCVVCHHSGSSFGPRIKGRTLTEIAAEMWDHAPRMKVQPVHFNPGEMRELLSYLWARQFFEDAGDAGRGKRIFTVKHCETCHGDASTGAPKLTGGSFSGITMVSALWHHGPRMLEQMTGKGIRWPRFDRREMSDLIAYLNSGHKGK